VKTKVVLQKLVKVWTNYPKSEEGKFSTPDSPRHQSQAADSTDHVIGHPSELTPLSKVSFKALQKIAIAYDTIAKTHGEMYNFESAIDAQSVAVEIRRFLKVHLQTAIQWKDFQKPSGSPPLENENQGYISGIAKIDSRIAQHLRQMVAWGLAYCAAAYSTIATTSTVDKEKETETDTAADSSSTYNDTMRRINDMFFRIEKMVADPQIPEPLVEEQAVIAACRAALSFHAGSIGTATQQSLQGMQLIDTLDDLSITRAFVYANAGAIHFHREKLDALRRGQLRDLHKCHKFLSEALTILEQLHQREAERRQWWARAVQVVRELRTVEEIEGADESRSDIAAVVQERLNEEVNPLFEAAHQDFCAWLRHAHTPAEAGLTRIGWLTHLEQTLHRELDLTTSDPRHLNLLSGIVHCQMAAHHEHEATFQTAQEQYRQGLRRMKCNLPGRHPLLHAMRVRLVCMPSAENLPLHVPDVQPYYFRVRWNNHTPRQLGHGGATDQAGLIPKTSREKARQVNAELNAQNREHLEEVARIRKAKEREAALRKENEAAELKLRQLELLRARELRLGAVGNGPDSPAKICTFNKYEVPWTFRNAAVNRQHDAVYKSTHAKTKPDKPEELSQFCATDPLPDRRRYKTLAQSGHSPNKYASPPHRTEGRSTRKRQDSLVLAKKRQELQAAQAAGGEDDDSSSQYSPPARGTDGGVSFTASPPAWQHSPPTQRKRPLPHRSSTLDSAALDSPTGTSRNPMPLAENVQYRSTGSFESMFDQHHQQSDYTAPSYDYESGSSPSRTYGSPQYTASTTRNPQTVTLGSMGVMFSPAWQNMELLRQSFPTPSDTVPYGDGNGTGTGTGTGTTEGYLQGTASTLTGDDSVSLPRMDPTPPHSLPKHRRHSKISSHPASSHLFPPVTDSKQQPLTLKKSPVNSYQQVMLDRSRQDPAAAMDWHEKLDGHWSNTGKIEPSQRNQKPRRMLKVTGSASDVTTAKHLGELRSSLQGAPP
jgi:hypothetical protein